MPQNNNFSVIRENEKILKERAHRFRLSEQHIDADIEEMIVFEQGGTHYAIPLDLLAEIRSLNRITALPLVSAFIMGVINVRGRILPVYRFNHTNVFNDDGFALVGYGMAAHVAIWADDILGTINVNKSDIKQAPVSFSQNYVRGVSSSGMVFIDLEKLVNDKKFYMA